MKFFAKLTALFESLSSKPSIGGLEISSSVIRFSRVGNNKVFVQSLRLTPGLISKGKILDRDNLLLALQKLRGSITGGKKNIMVEAVVSLPPSAVFTQSFSLPRLNSGKLDEAAQLNLRMISPLEREVSYSDWQVLGSSEDKVELLGAFTEKSFVDDLNGLLREAGFLPAAFEFPALSLARVIRSLSFLSNFPASFILVSLSGEGVDTSIIRNGSLHFSYFHSWESIHGGEKEIKIERLKDIISGETNRVINFSLTHFNESPLGAVLVAPGLEEELAKFLQSDLKLKVFSSRLKRYAELSPIWFVSLGAALRGLIPRESDILISLSGVSAEEEFYHLRALSFIALWRNIVGAALALFVLIFSGVLFFTANIEEKVSGERKLVLTAPDIKRVEELQNKALDFNRLVDLVGSAESNVKVWSPFLAELYRSGEGKIAFDRIAIQSPGAPVRLEGRAPNEQAALNFKDVLSRHPKFTQVTLPLSSISTLPDGVSFSITLLVKDLDFE